MIAAGSARARPIDTHFAGSGLDGFHDSVGLNPFGPGESEADRHGNTGVVLQNQGEGRFDILGEAEHGRAGEPKPGAAVGGKDSIDCGQNSAGGESKSGAGGHLWSEPGDGGERHSNQCSQPEEPSGRNDHRGTGRFWRMRCNTSAARMPSSSDSGRSKRRCSRTGKATARISSGLTKSRLARAAQARAARTSAWVARGPAPTRMLSSARVRRTSSTAYS